MIFIRHHRGTARHGHVDHLEGLLDGVKAQYIAAYS